MKCSEVTPEGINATDLGETLLNGNNIAMVRPIFACRKLSLFRSLCLLTCFHSRSLAHAPQRLRLGLT